MNTQLSHTLGSHNSCPIAVHTKTFSTSVFKVLIWIFATTTKICTSDSSSQVHTQSLLRYPKDLPTRSVVRTSRASTNWTAEYKWEALAPSIFRASCFGRWVVTHSLADSDFHGHRPAVLSNQHLSWDLMSAHFGTLTQRSVHPTVPVLLDKNVPTRHSDSINVYRAYSGTAIPAEGFGYYWAAGETSMSNLRNRLNRVAQISGISISNYW